MCRVSLSVRCPGCRKRWTEWAYERENWNGLHRLCWKCGYVGLEITIERRGPPRTALILALLFLVGCTVQAAPPPPAAPSCVRLVMLADSLMIAAYPPPCDRALPPAALMWRIPSRHRWCDGSWLIDPEGRGVGVEWGECVSAPLRGDGA